VADPDARARRDLRDDPHLIVSHRLLLVVVGLVFAAAVTGMVLLWPVPDDLPEPAPPDSSAGTTEVLSATLTEVEALGEESTEGLAGLLPGAVDVEVTARLASGERVRFVTTDDTGGLYARGQRVELTRITQPGGAATYYISDFQRDRPLLVLAALFVVVVLAFGRFQGLRALLGLAASIAVIVVFIVPAILAGRPPVLVAIVGSGVVMVVTLYLAHGFHRKTTAAVVGTAGALLLTAGLAQVSVELTALTGLASEEARVAAFEVSGLSLQGLLLAGIIVGGLGVLDDVTISQSSTVFELRGAAPEAGLGQLLRAALNVGRDHISATINTLFLAYAGAALPLLILFTLSQQPVASVLSSEIVAVEIVRTLVGSIGLIAAVPLTTLLAAALARGSTEGELDAEEEEWLRILREV
jgi:uncharacterized membrane protein